MMATFDKFGKEGEAAGRKTPGRDREGLGELRAPKKLSWRQINFLQCQLAQTHNVICLQKVNGDMDVDFCRPCRHVAIKAILLPVAILVKLAKTDGVVTYNGASGVNLPCFNLDGATEFVNLGLQAELSSLICHRLDNNRSRHSKVSVDG